MTEDHFNTNVKIEFELFEEICKLYINCSFFVFSSPMC